MKDVEVKGVFQVTVLIGTTEGGLEGIGAARFNNSAIFVIACLVESPRVRVGKAVFGGLFRIVMISEAAVRR